MKTAATGDIFDQLPGQMRCSGQACRPCTGSCSPIPGRGCFGDLPGDEIVVSPPSLIVEPLFEVALTAKKSLGTMNYAEVQG